MGNAKSDISSEEKMKVLGLDCSVDSILSKMKQGNYKSVVVMTGAGISVSCGIPDFRTPGTGLYDNLKKYNLPSPESVFTMDYFRESKGEAFYKLAKEMWPDHFNPSPAHCFIRLLQDKEILSRCFTQNIDTLERAAGVTGEKMVESHGSFASASCIKCHSPFDQVQCKKQILERQIPIRCTVPSCGGLVKPDIVFFGEGLPPKFYLCAKSDFPQADLLIVLGTSLTVHPFAGLIEAVAPNCPRLLLNMKPVGLRNPNDDGLRLRQAENYRDVMIEGPCDDAVRAICDELGWRADLESLIQTNQCLVGSTDAAIDTLVAFPAMGPDGFKYNWRTDPESDLPPIFAFHQHPDDYDVDDLILKATDTAHKMSLCLLQDYSSLEQGGEVALILCITDESHKAWDESHAIALVENGTRYDFTVLEGAEPLNEPMQKEEDGENSKSSFFQLAIGIPFSGTDFEIWYIDRTCGEVRARWGGLKVEAANFDDFDISELVQGMGELPSHLLSPED